MRVLALALSLIGLTALALDPPPKRPRPALRVYPTQTNGLPIMSAGECATVPLAGSYGETVTFTRATPSSSCIRTDGGLVWLDGGQPATSAGALKIRPALSNSLRYSEQIDQWSTWNAGTVTFDVDSALAPNNTTTADLVHLSATSGSGQSIIYEYNTTTGVKSCGIWLKSPDGGSGNVYIAIAITPSTYTCTQVAFGPTWGRAVNENVDSVAQTEIDIGNTGTKCGAGGQPAVDVLMWGAQCNIGARLLDYVGPTANASVNANNETASGPAVALGTTPSFAATVNVTSAVSGCALAVGGQATLCLDAGYPLCSVLQTDGGWQNLHSDAGTVSLSTNTKLSCHDDGVNLTVCRNRACNSVAVSGTANGASASTWLGSDSDGGGQLGGQVQDFCADTRPWVCQ